jgi:hypothetical protein
MDNIDFFPDAPSLTVLSSPDAKLAYKCFFKETGIFNDAKIPYHLVTGPNSNSYARTMLDKCNVVYLKPALSVTTLLLVST